mgnify:CR=1 FL=1|tara:strand:- start:308 stop:904 length:597 start_codon:yes stop_codon:yes gene_type:complete
MNKELVKFIELCLADGEISEKERKVIFRKAEELGVPKDECEIILQGLVLKNAQNDKQPIKKSEQLAAEKENNKQDETIDSEKPLDNDVKDLQKKNNNSELSVSKSRFIGIGCLSSISSFFLIMIIGNILAKLGIDISSSAGNNDGELTGILLASVAMGFGTVNIILKELRKNKKRTILFLLIPVFPIVILFFMMILGL